MITSKPIRFIVKPLTKGMSNEVVSETAQCVYLAAAQFTRKDIDTDYVRSHMVRTASRVNVNYPTKDIVDKLTPGWQRSCEKIANFTRTYLSRSDYTFHRDSPVVKQIYTKFNELNRSEGKPFGNSNKWQPADIWAIAGTVNVSRIKSIEELNQYLHKGIDNKLIIPISLKMSVGQKPVKAEPTNMANTPKTNLPVPKYDSVRVSTGKKDWTSSNQTQIRFKLERGRSGWFEIRTFDAKGDLKGELNLSDHQSARHGKIGIKDILRIMREAGAKVSIPNTMDLRIKSGNYDPDLIKSVYDLAQLLEPSKITLEQFQEMFPKKGPTWLTSKYQSMLLIQAFNKLTDTKKTEVCQKMYSQAKSSGELAAPFVKIG